MATNHGGGAPAPRYTRKKPMSARARTALDTRTEKRYEALTGRGGTVKGVDAADGFSRKEAKLVKKARRYQKAKRRRARALKTYESSPYNPANNPNSPF